jgi:amidase
MTQIHELSALEQGAAIRAGELSPTEITQHYLDRIATLDPAIGAFVTVTAEAALAQAEIAEQELRSARGSGRSLGPLHGVPIAMKDVVHIEDVPCTQGSTVYADDVADLDDHVVTRVKQAGLVILGTTNTPEFALPCYTENQLAGPTRNPWSTAHSPGGSSGGSAAAVAAGLAPLAHGTDAGGSIRIPASACGVVGLKPSRGRISDGPVGHDVTGLSVHGVLARSAADAEALLDVMSGLMPGDAYTCPRLVRAPGSRPLRIAALPQPMLPGIEAHDDCLSALERTAALAVEAGHQVETMELSADRDVAEAFARAWSVHAANLPVDEDDEELLTPFTRYMRDLGRQVSAVELHTALSTFRSIGQMLADIFFASYDVILTPTLATPPPLIGEFTSGPDEQTNYDRMSAFMPYTPMYNIAGLPAISLPLHRNDDGLPIGVMLGARYGDEATLLDLAGDLVAAAGDQTKAALAVPELVD